MKKRKTKSKNTPQWKRQSGAIRRKKGVLGPFSGTGRYIIGLLILAGVIRFCAVQINELTRSHPLFTVRNVIVEGADYIDTEKILQHVSIKQGITIFETDLLSISTSIKDAFPTEDFTVYRRLPDTIAIRVRERKPVALLSAKKLIGVDADGVPLPHIGASFVESLPIITGIKNVSSLSDSTVKTRLLTGIKLLERISDDSPEIFSRISEINVSTMSELGISLIDNGLEVIIGEKDWGYKIPNLEKVINEVSKRVETVKAVDIRIAGKIFVRK